MYFCNVKKLNFMGRDITILGLNYNKINSLSNEIQNDEFQKLFDQYKNNYNSVNFNVLLEKLKSEPKKLMIDEVFCLVWSFLDLWEFNNDNVNYLKKKKKLAELGIEYFIEINTTNACCTFIEIFFDTIEKLNLKWEEREDNCYKFNPDDFDQILKKMVLITTFFNNQEHEYIYSEIDFEIEEEYKIELETLYQEQLKYRSDNIEYYSRKWGTDYFNFAFFCMKFIKSRRKVYDFDTFIIIDSF